MDSDHTRRMLLVDHLPPLAANEIWQPLDPRDRLECNHFYQCGQEARWQARQVPVRLCDYHRHLAEIERILAEIARERQEAVA